MAVAFFQITDSQPSQMFAESVAKQGGSVALGSARRLIRGLQELFVQYDLDGFHVWRILHSFAHNQWSLRKAAFKTKSRARRFLRVSQQLLESRMSTQCFQIGILRHARRRVRRQTRINRLE